ncbi:MAG: type II toxin-antitoxin system RelB/DinJ family antitoxin [Atopobiaceae bacterium]|nr:type II toxin-antitoxin system RelB/DinJ family antitoxin [Atopobiaceae bacterium]
MASVTVRVDDQTKREAAEIVEDFGFDLSSVTRAFYRQIVREHRIPLTLSYPEPNDESLESIRDAEAILASGGHGYRTAREMLEAALEA